MSRPDVVVAGAGVIGAMIAWNLARRGARVVLVDPAGAAVRPAASWASAGGLRSQGRSPAEQPLSLRAAELWRSFEDEVGADVEMAFGGHLHIAETQAEAAAIEARLAADRAGGVAIERVTAREIREIAPELTHRACLGAYTPGDGQAHPGRVTRALVADAGRCGVELIFGRPARPMVEAGRVTGLALADGGTVEAGMTVLATGAWTTELIAGLGLDLPIRARGLQMLLSDLAPRDLLAPTVTAVGRNLSLKQLRSGAFMLGGRWFARQTGEGLVTLPIDAHASRQWSGAVAILPRLARHRLAHQWAGTEAQSVDGQPFIGRMPVPGLYVACGFSNHGFQISPAVGALVAEDLTTGAAPLLVPFSPARAARVAPNRLAAFRAEPILEAA